MIFILAQILVGSFAGLILWGICDF